MGTREEVISRKERERQVEGVGHGTVRGCGVMHCWRGPNHGEAFQGANLQRTLSVVCLV